MSEVTSSVPFNPPSLDDDSFVDKAIATMAITLWDRHYGGTTNAVQLLVRPTDMRSDESGEHPGETFVMVTLTREELRALLTELDEDWALQVAVTGDPNSPIEKGVM